MTINTVNLKGCLIVQLSFCNNSLSNTVSQDYSSVVQFHDNTPYCGNNCHGNYHWKMLHNLFSISYKPQLYVLTRLMISLIWDGTLKRITKILVVPYTCPVRDNIAVSKIVVSLQVEFDVLLLVPQSSKRCIGIYMCWTFGISVFEITFLSLGSYLLIMTWESWMVIKHMFYLCKWRVKVLGFQKNISTKKIVFRKVIFFFSSSGRISI